jgi:hypothetical protein
MGAVQYIGTGRLGASQDVAYGSSSAASAAFGAQTYKVRLVATTDCRSASATARRRRLRPTPICPRWRRNISP